MESFLSTYGFTKIKSNRRRQLPDVSPSVMMRRENVKTSMVKGCRNSTSNYDFLQAAEKLILPT